MQASARRVQAAPRRDGRAQRADVLADLVEFHTARPGITEAPLGACTPSDGRTGYDLLAGHVPEGARAVLDLGAG